MKIKKKNVLYLCNAAKAVSSEKFIILNSYIRKRKMSQINVFSFHFKEIEK